MQPSDPLAKRGGGKGKGVERSFLGGTRAKRGGSQNPKGHPLDCARGQRPLSLLLKERAPQWDCVALVRVAARESLP